MNLIKLFTFGAPLVGQLALASVAVMDYSALVYVPNLIGKGGGWVGSMDERMGFM